MRARSEDDWEKRINGTFAKKLCSSSSFSHAYSSGEQHHLLVSGSDLRNRQNLFLFAHIPQQNLEPESNIGPNAAFVWKVLGAVFGMVCKHLTMVRHSVVTSWLGYYNVPYMVVSSKSI